MYKVYWGYWKQVKSSCMCAISGKMFSKSGSEFGGAVLVAPQHSTLLYSATSREKHSSHHQHQHIPAI